MPGDGLSIGSQGEGSVKDGTPTSGLHNRMVGHIIPRSRIQKEDHLEVSERNMSVHV